MKIISDTNELQINIVLEQFYAIPRQNNEEIM